MRVSTKWDDDEVVQRFRTYLMIPSVHPDPDYGPCVEFLRGQADEIGLKMRVHELVPKKPVVIVTWEGTQPELKTILLNSHMDVVPVYEEHWSFPPFDACITEDGWIYARGTQDCKCLGMAWLEGVRKLKDSGVRLKRTVHISFVPDEEIGGQDGMQIFSESQHFKDLNVGIELDESAPHTTRDHLIAFNAEKTCRRTEVYETVGFIKWKYVYRRPQWRLGCRNFQSVHYREVTVICRGNPGHGSLVFSNTAGEKIQYIINKFMTLRSQELKKLKDDGAWSGDILSINLTKLAGGVQVNVVPENLSVSFDIRIPPSVNHEEFEELMTTWCKEAGDKVTFEYFKKNPEVPPTRIDGSVPFWTVIKKVAEESNMTLECKTCPGATDARYVRLQGVPAINLTPFDNTPTLLHDHDERLHIDTYKKGIDLSTRLIHALADHVILSH